MNTPKVRRQKRIRSHILVSTDRPRLSVHRSNSYCYAQIIDVNGNSLLGLSEKTLKVEKLRPVERAHKLGEEIAKIAKTKKINRVVFDKGRFAYHGRIKAIADGAREGGLEF